MGKNFPRNIVSPEATTVNIQHKRRETRKPSQLCEKLEKNEYLSDQASSRTSQLKYALGTCGCHLANKKKQFRFLPNYFNGCFAGVVLHLCMQTPLYRPERTVWNIRGIGAKVTLVQYESVECGCKRYVRRYHI